MSAIIKPVQIPALQITCPCGWTWVFKGRRKWSMKHAQCPSCYKVIDLEKEVGVVD